MPTTTKISYLRKGRKLRCTGTVIDTDAHTGLTKVKPLRDDWRMVLVTAAEIDAGREKAPFQPRKKTEQPAPRKPRTPKPAPKPRWQQLIEHVKDMKELNPPGYRQMLSPEKLMDLSIELADQLQKAHDRMSELLPIHTTKP